MEDIAIDLSRTIEGQMKNAKESFPGKATPAITTLPPEIGKDPIILST